MFFCLVSGAQNFADYQKFCEWLDYFQKQGGGNPRPFGKHEMPTVRKRIRSQSQQDSIRRIKGGHGSQSTDIQSDCERPRTGLRLLLGWGVPRHC